MIAVRSAALWLTIMAAIGVAAYCAGQSEGRTSLLLEQNAAALDTNRIAIVAATAAVDTAAKQTVVAKAASVTTRAERAPVRSRVRVVSASQVSVDS